MLNFFRWSRHEHIVGRDKISETKGLLYTAGLREPRAATGVTSTEPDKLVETSTVTYDPGERAKCTRAAYDIAPGAARRARVSREFLKSLRPLFSFSAGLASRSLTAQTRPAAAAAAAFAEFRNQLRLINALARVFAYKPEHVVTTMCTNEKRGIFGFVIRVIYTRGRNAPTNPSWLGE